MDCKNAYLMQNIPYVLCRIENQPDGKDRRELFHAMCIHQEECPRQNCHKLTPGWVSCVKLARTPQDGARVAFGAETTTRTAVRKSAQRGARKPKTQEDKPKDEK